MILAWNTFAFEQGTYSILTQRDTLLQRKISGVRGRQQAVSRDIFDTRVFRGPWNYATLHFLACLYVRSVLLLRGSREHLRVPPTPATETFLGLLTCHNSWEARETKSPVVGTVNNEPTAAVLLYRAPYWLLFNCKYPFLLCTGGQRARGYVLC